MECERSAGEGLAKIATSLQARENQLSNEANIPGNIQLAGAFVNNANKGFSSRNKPNYYSNMKRRSTL